MPKFLVVIASLAFAAAAHAAQVAKLLKNPNTMLVYAAAGRPGAGATREELRSRSRLPDREVEVAIRDLRRAGLLRPVEGGYEPGDLHLFFKVDDKNQWFLTLFQAACRLAAERAACALDSDREMFFASSFCVDMNRLPELKTALRTTVLRFVDDSIVPDGDGVVRLVTSLHV